MRIAVLRLALSLVAAIALGLSATTSAQASTVVCKPGAYSGGTIEEGNIDVAGVFRLRASGLPKLTDGYAPRCLVADSALRLVQGPDWQSRLPKRIWLRGARWDGGRWNVSSTEASRYTSVRLSRGSKRITFRYSEPH